MYFLHRHAVRSWDESRARPRRLVEGTEPEGRPAPARAGNEDAGEGWLLDNDLPPPRPWLESIDRGVLVIAAVGIGFLIAVLAAAGVFSSGPGTSVPTVTSTPTLTTSTTQPTTTPAAQLVPVPTTSLKLSVSVARSLPQRRSASALMAIVRGESIV